MLLRQNHYLSWESLTIHRIVRRRCINTFEVRRYLGKQDGEDKYGEFEEYKGFIEYKQGVVRNVFNDEMYYRMIIYIDGTYPMVGELDELKVDGKIIRPKYIARYNALNNGVELMEVYC